MNFGSKDNFLGINGGPVVKFTEAVSFVVNCEIQELRSLVEKYGVDYDPEYLWG